MEGEPQWGFVKNVWSGRGEAVGWAAKSVLPQGRGGASGERVMASQGEDTGIGKGAQGEENLGGDR